MRKYRQEPGSESDERTRQQIPEVAKSPPGALLAMHGQVGNAAVADMLTTSAIQRAPVEDGGDQRRPWVPNAQVAQEDRWFANTTPARSDGVVLSGHGNWSNGDGYFRVPRGTRVHFYTLLGQTITDNLGHAIEGGQSSGASVEQGRQSGSAEIYVGGRSAPDVVLSTPFELTITGDPVVATRSGSGFRIEMNPGSQNNQTFRVANLSDPRLAGHSITLNGAMKLSQLLEPDMGDVHFAACRFTETPATPQDRLTRNQDEGLGP